MFRITEDSSSRRLLQCLVKKYKNDCIVSVDKDMVGVMAAYSDPLSVQFTVYEGTSYTVNCIIIDGRCKHEDCTYNSLVTRNTIVPVLSKMSPLYWP
jgi:hypothetical protein